jgi:hypothetical protein
MFKFILLSVLSFVFMLVIMNTYSLINIWNIIIALIVAGIIAWIGCSILKKEDGAF